MATKKSTSSSKKSSAAKAAPKSTTKTNVTTVKAAPASKPASKLFGAKLSSSPRLAAGVAEFIGTFLLAAVILATQGNPLIVGFALVALIVIIGALSGAHLNPIITIGAWATRKIEGPRALIYVLAQVLGAMFAIVVLGYFVGQAPAVSEQAAAIGQTAPELFTAAAIPEGKEIAVLLAEFLAATVFAFAVAASIRLKEKAATALGIGFGIFVALTIGSYAAGMVSGTTIINPAVAVSLQAIDLKSVWPVAVYVVAAVLGGVAGFFLNEVINSEASKK